MSSRFSLIAAALLTTAFANAASAEEIRLFNGRDLSGWTAVLDNENAKAEDVWSVHGGVLVCKGKPRGYIQTDKQYSNYRLTLEWRWAPEGEKRNSGVLLHSSTPKAIGIWPKSIEAQLAAGNAGDIWVIGTTVDIPNADSRVKGRRHRNLTEDSEKPIGEWNRYEIVCEGDSIKLIVNGELVNHATNASVTSGRVCLQSEGAEVHFRNVVLEPLD